MLRATNLADLLRYVTLLYALVTVALSSGIMVRFLRRDPPVLVRRHVVRISLTYVGMVIIVAADVVSRLGETLTFQAPLLFAVLTLAMMAQVPLYQFERNTRRQVGGHERDHGAVTRHGVASRTPGSPDAASAEASADPYATNAEGPPLL